MTRPPATQPSFTGNPIDRADEIRSDPERLRVAFADPRARLLLLDGLDPVLAEGGLLETIAMPPDAQLGDLALLGLRPGGAPLFVSLRQTMSDEPPTIPPKVWTVAMDLQPEELALYGCARSLVDWHQRHGFCARCGGASAPTKAGWSRLCGTCGTEHFPRVDPVVIMLAEYEGKILIGRNGRFPPRRFSALAGFVEPGESIEEAVRREVFEEAGVRIGRVDYLMSQPWPFPSQLMVACIGQALDDAITIDPKELAEAMWVDKDQVRAALAQEEGALFDGPTPIAVAHHMLRHWLGE